MASTAGMVHGEGFWLPSEFFSDAPESVEAGSGVCFPKDFPYDFGTWGDEDLQENFLVISTSPHSSLASIARKNGCPKAVPSVPFCDGYDESVEDLIHRAAGQVARLKFKGSESIAAKPIRPSFTPCTFKTAFPSSSPVSPLTENQRFGIQYTKRQPYNELGLVNWTTNKNPSSVRQIPVPRPTAGAAARKTCTGTGVFLPRRYGNNNYDVNAFSSSVTGQKTGPSSVIQGRDHRSNLTSMIMINGGATHYPRPKHGTLLNTGLIPDRGSNGLAADPILALRTAILMQRQQQRLRAM